MFKERKLNWVLKKDLRFWILLLKIFGTLIWIEGLAVNPGLMVLIG